MDKIKKIALAYSGGLDTSIIIHWLKNHYDAEIIAICTNVGQEEELDGLEHKAIKSGASKYFCIDIRKELVEDYIFPMAMAGALYEGKYLLGTSIARPIQAKTQVEIALDEGCDTLSHGCTGKGNSFPVRIRHKHVPGHRYDKLLPSLASWFGRIYVPKTV